MPKNKEEKMHEKEEKRLEKERLKQEKIDEKLKKKEDGGNIDLNKLRFLIEKCGGKTKKNCK